MIYYCQKGKKNGGSLTLFWKEHAPKNTLNLKNQASVGVTKCPTSLNPRKAVAMAIFPIIVQFIA